MYDSVNNFLEQQQKFANFFNKTYIPELIKIQQAYNDVMKQMQPSITVALKNMSEASILVGKTLRSLETDKAVLALNRAIEINRQVTQSINNMWEKVDVDCIASVMRQVSLSTEAIQNTYVDLFTGYGEIVKRLISLSENEIEFIVEGTDFTAEEVLKDINELKEEILEPGKEVLIHDNLLLKEKWDNFLKSHPALANTIWIISVFIGLISGIFAVNELGELVISTTQEVIVKMQGNEDIFFIDVDSAKLYTEPNSHSTIITRVLYAEEVTQIDSVKMWDKVIYINPDGEEMTGWIAKRNLMPYKDYQFNSDDLYDMESEVVFEPEEEEKTEEIKECDCSASNARVEGISAGNIANYTLVR